MSSLWEDVKNAIVDGYVHAADKAEELTQIGKAKVEILRLNRQIANIMSEVGGMTFDLFDKGEQSKIAKDEDIRVAVEKIQAHRAEIEMWQAEIEQAKAERVARAAVETGTPDEEQGTPSK